MTPSHPRVLSVDDFHALTVSEQHDFLIGLVYRFCLQRAPEPDMLAARVAGLDDGIPFADMLVEIATSPEALAIAPDADLAADCSDGEFLMIVGRLLNGRGLVPSEIASGQRFLNGQATMRAVYVKAFLDGYITDKLNPKIPAIRAHDVSRCRILGTDKILTRELWDERAAVLPPPHALRRPAADEHRPCSSAPKVSMIASLYRGGKFIERFSTQHHVPDPCSTGSELIIIDAASPDGEHETIARLPETAPQHHLRTDQLPHRNLRRLEQGRGDGPRRLSDQHQPSTTSATRIQLLSRRDLLDRQGRCRHRLPRLLLQALTLFVTSTKSPLSGSRASCRSLRHTTWLAFNSPHNAPMWRKSLHNELGPFRHQLPVGRRLRVLGPLHR